MNEPLVKPVGGFDLDAIWRAYETGARDAHATIRRGIPSGQTFDGLVQRSADAYVKSVAIAVEAQAEPRLSADDIRAVNQAASHLDGVLFLSAEDRHRIALLLFAIAGNPMPADAAAMTKP